MVLERLLELVQLVAVGEPFDRLDRWRRRPGRRASCSSSRACRRRSPSRRRSCPVSQPMWLPVRSRSSRMKWIRSLRASTSRSYVVPLTVTEIDAGRRDRCSHAQLLAFGAWSTARTASTSARWVRYSLGRVDVGRRIEVGAAHSRAHGVGVGRGRLQHDGHASTQPSAIRDAAVRRMRRRVDDAGSLDAERDGGEAVGAPGGTRDLRQQLARRRRRSCRRRGRSRPRAPCARRPRRRSSSRRRARRAAAAGGSSGRSCRCCRRSCRGSAPGRRRSARTPRRGSAAPAPRSSSTSSV